MDYGLKIVSESRVDFVLLMCGYVEWLSAYFES